MNTQLQGRSTMCFNRNSTLLAVLWMCDEDDHAKYLSIMDEVLNFMPIYYPSPPTVEDIYAEQ